MGRQRVTLRSTVVATGKGSMIGVLITCQQARQAWRRCIASCYLDCLFLCIVEPKGKSPDTWGCCGLWCWSWFFFTCMCHNIGLLDEMMQRRWRLWCPDRGCGRPISAWLWPQTSVLLLLPLTEQKLEASRHFVHLSHWLDSRGVASCEGRCGQ